MKDESKNRIHWNGFDDCHKWMCEINKGNREVVVRRWERHFPGGGVGAGEGGQKAKRKTHDRPNKKKKCNENRINKITFLDVFSFYRLLYFWKYRLFPLAVRDVKHYRQSDHDSDVQSMNVALYQCQIQYPAPAEIFSTMKFPKRHQPAMNVSMMSNYRDARALYSFKWFSIFVDVVVVGVYVCVFVVVYYWLSGGDWLTEWLTVWRSDWVTV